MTRTVFSPHCVCLYTSQAFSRAHRIGQSNKVSEHDVCVTCCVTNVKGNIYSALVDWSAYDSRSVGDDLSLCD